MGRCVAVLGALRSGTSCTAGVLHNMGVDMGRGHLQGANAQNPKGHFEDLRWQTVNKRITGLRYGAEHNDPTESQKLYASIAEKCDGKALWGMKDPRMCITFPFILSVVKSDVYIVAVHRSFQSSVQSLVHHSELHYGGRYRMNYKQAAEVVTELLECRQQTIDAWTGPLFHVFYEDLLDTLDVKPLAKFAFDGTGIAPNIQAGRQFIAPPLNHWRQHAPD